MNHKNGSSPQGYGVYFKEIAYICRQDIYYATRNRIDLFSRVKSGKFFEDENKLTFPNHTIMAWAVAYFSPPVYQSLHDEMSLQLASLFYVPIEYNYHTTAAQRHLFGTILFIKFAIWASNWFEKT